MCSTGLYQSENGKDQCSVCETGLFNRPKKADLWFVYIGANHTLCGGDKTLVPAEGMRSYLKTDGGYSKPAYHRAGWLGNASSAWLWDPQPIIGTSDFTIVHNDSTGNITHTDINLVEYSGFKWKFLLDEDTDELLEGALPEQDNEVERVHGEIYPYCRSERCKTDKTFFAVGSSVLGKCQVASVKVPRVMQKDEGQSTRVLETQTVSQ
jgi:hypothetical protein